MRIAIIGLQWFGILAIAHALMMIGADEITSLERHVFTMRPLGRVLALYGANPSPWIAAHFPALLAGAAAALLAWPAWAVLAVLGSAIMLIAKKLER